MGTVGGFKTTYRLSKAVIGLFQPEVFIGLFLVDFTTFGAEINEALDDMDQLEKKKEEEKQYRLFIKELTTYPIMKAAE